jgi:hypothetical protein
MDSLLSFLVLTKTLSESKPVGQKCNCSIQFFSTSALIAETDFGTCFPVVLWPCKVAIHYHCHLQGRYDARQDVGQKEMTESNQPKRGHNDMPESQENLFSGASVKQFEGVDAEENKQQETQQGKCSVIVKEPEL